uniref:Uncharacterized protein n=1 Tax=Esox lucius TaxID=8010 RepID=A0A3P8YAI5_ESOLU
GFGFPGFSATPIELGNLLARYSRLLVAVRTTVSLFLSACDLSDWRLNVATGMFIVSYILMFVIQPHIRKRQRSAGDEENGQLVPQAKRSSRGSNPLSPELGRDAWDSEVSSSTSNKSSNSETSAISSPDNASGSSSSSQCASDSLGGAQPRVPGPCSPLSSCLASELAGPTDLASYHQINRILREAHFESLQCRGNPRDT